MSWHYDTIVESDESAIQRFIDLWDERRAGRPMPSRSDFVPEDLREWFGHVLILDVIEGGADFYYRLVGVEIARALGRDYTGRRMTECIYDDSRAAVIEEFREVVEACRPVLREGHVTWAPDRSWRAFKSVHAPLASDGQTVDKTMGVLLIGHAMPRPSREWRL